MTILKDISVETFFKEYWQKKPLVVRGALAKDLGLISAEELAGYSLDDEIESRLIIRKNDSWQLEQGPLDEQIFADIDGKPWTLLVQSLDYFHPPLHKLVQACNFIPRWRLDDVMVSYATDGAGVGPHLDKYDVFLIQGEGQRHWQVGHKEQLVTAHNPHPEIAQIEPFTADLDIVLETGDLLYIPPNTPHWGTSIGNSICYSVGFRAPNIGSIVQNLLMRQEGSLDTLWADQGKLTPSSSSGELTRPIIDWSSQQVSQIFNSRDLSIAIGREVTEVKYPDLLEFIEGSEAEALAESAFLQGVQLKPLARMAYFEEKETLLTFINGEFFEYPLSLKPVLEKLNFNQAISPQDYQGAPSTTLESFLIQAFLLDALSISLQ